MSQNTERFIVSSIKPEEEENLLIAHLQFSIVGLCLHRFLFILPGFHLLLFVSSLIFLFCVLSDIVVVLLRSYFQLIPAAAATTTVIAIGDNDLVVIFKFQIFRDIFPYYFFILTQSPRARCEIKTIFNLNFPYSAYKFYSFLYTPSFHLIRLTLFIFDIYFSLSFHSPRIIALDETMLILFLFTDKYFRLNR